jgi:DNA repair exonuclease SbcCD ATPase subunit
MPRAAEHTHRINVRETQLEMQPDAPLGSSPIGEEFDGKLQMAQQQLEQLQHQREELERRKRELEELDNRRKAFLNTQAELSERLNSSVTKIDRALFEMREEIEDLEQTRQCFAEHITRIDKLDPQTWSRSNMAENLERSLAAIEHAEDEYNQAAQHFEGTRSGAIFGRGRKRGIRSGGHSEFLHNMRNGFAFNLPILLVGVGALIVYLLK